MQLEINGKTEQIDNIGTVADLLRHFDVAPVRVAVEVNEELVTRSEYESATLSAGDRIEIVTFVGGG